MKDNLHRAKDFCLYVMYRVYRDHCAQIAASLTFTSLLATVPFLVVSFSIIREFPVFPAMINNLQEVLLQIFTPDIGVEVKQYIQKLISKGAGLPFLSLTALFFTAVMMLYTIDDALNRIWQVEYKRRTWFSLLVYFVVVLSGPVLIGISLILTSYFVSISSGFNSSDGIGLLSSVPWLVTFIAFTSLYKWVPSTLVKWPYAIIGGLVATVLFELAKWGFAVYIQWVPTYDLLYGTLAAIPLTLLWIYVSWLVVLVGAETTRCLATYLYGVEEADLTARQLIGFFLRTRDGVATLDQISAWGYLAKKRVRSVIKKMLEIGILEELGPHKYALSDRARQMNMEELRIAALNHLNQITNKKTKNPL